MGTAAPTKDDRINLRLKHSVKLMLERAASFEGKTVSKFILGCAMKQAEKTIHDHEIMNLNMSDSEAFFEALSAPVEFNDELMTAFDEHQKRVTSK